MKDRVPGEEGIWVLILGEMTAFALFFAVYLSARADQPDLFHSSELLLSRSHGAVNTVILLTSSLCVVAAVHAQREGSKNLTRRLLLGAVACGLGFVALKALEYSELVRVGLTPVSNGFFTYYYALTLIHLFHLFAGMGVLLFLRSLACRTVLTQRQIGYFESGACYWHMVDLLWILIFPLLYLID